MVRTVAIATTADDVSSCMELRRLVFVDEQGVPEHEEIDGKDGHSTHVLARLDGAPVGTARFRVSDDAVKIERMAVLAECRGAGIGSALIGFIISHAKERTPAKVARLSAQIQALDFYRKLGFREHGDVYLDAGIAHMDMKLSLDR